MNKRMMFLFMVTGLILALTVGPGMALAEFKGTIKIANVGDYTGPAAKSSSEMRDGIQDYARYMNEKKGGIAGYKLVVEPYDTKFDPNVMLRAYKRYYEELDVKFLYSEIASLLPAAMKIANDKKFVLMCTSGVPKYTTLSKEDEKAGKNNYFFIHTPDIPLRLASAVEWIKQDWKAKGKKGVPKISGFNLDTEAGHMATTAGRIYTERAGFKWMGGTYHERSITDAVSQVALFKKWGVDYVIGAGDLDQPLTVLVKELARMNIKPIVMQHTCLGTAYLQTKDPAFEGHMSYQYCLAWPDTDNPEIAKIHALNKEWHPDVKSRVPLYVTAWHGAMIFCEALRRGVEKYGVENLNGPNIRASFETIKDFDVGGLSEPITYTNWDHQGNHALRWSVCKDGKLVPAGPFVKTKPLTDEERDYKYWLKD